MRFKPIIFGTEGKSWRQRLSTVVATMAIFWAALTYPSISSHALESDDEYAVKAALLYKLSRFVAWPAGLTAEKGEGEILICVVGKNPFAEHLDKLSAQMSKKRIISVQYFTKRTVNLENCQIAFISKSEVGKYEKSLNRIASKPVLTISDMHGFAKAGGTIEIMRRNNRLGFIFNMKSIEKSGLSVAAPLLQMSTLINEKKKP